VTSVLVTHDQEEALEVADRVVVMNQARIEQVGTPEEVFHQPASEFVIDFLGNVNVFHGRIEQGQAVLSGLAAIDRRVQSNQRRQEHLYVRPHELEIERHKNGVPSIEAQVARINPAGAVAKIALTTVDGDIQVDLPLERLAQLALQPGEQVFVSAKKARVFTPDYVI
jgi:sulfate/thiosulfate transport system ATP-binding protein